VDHDHSYKLLFSHQHMMADLMQGFITAHWVKTVDFSTLELVSSSHMSDDLRARDDDLIWRVRRADGWLYIYLLLEFQSHVDLPLMKQECRPTCHSRRITTSTESGSDERSLRRHGVAESLSSTKGRHSGYSHHTLSVIAHSWARYVTSNYEDHRQENTPNILGTIPV
jgi:hypothetical protein